VLYIDGVFSSEARLVLTGQGMVRYVGAAFRLKTAYRDGTTMWYFLYPMSGTDECLLLKKIKEASFCKFSMGEGILRSDCRQPTALIILVLKR
jgi:hypothetical protein